MAKITINPIASEFGSVASINNRFSQIADELNDKVLYRDNPLGEANEMQSDLDMNNHSLLNINIASSTVYGSDSLADYLSWAKEWAVEPEDSNVSAAAGGGGLDDYSALHWAKKSQAAQADIASRYLGSYASAPTTTVTGAMYWNTTTGNMYVWSGSAWVLLQASEATQAVNVNITDAGGYYAATEVEAALQEVPSLGMGLNDLWIPAREFTPMANNGCGAYHAVATVAGNGYPDYNSLPFDPLVDEYAQAYVALPKRNQGVAAVTILWSVQGSVGAGDPRDCKWSISIEAETVGSWLGVEPFSPVYTAIGTRNTATTYVNGTAMGSVPLAPIHPGFVVLRIGRLGSDAADTMPDDAEFLGVYVQWTNNALTDD